MSLVIMFNVTGYSEIVSVNHTLKETFSFNKDLLATDSATRFAIDPHWANGKLMSIFSGDNFTVSNYSVRSKWEGPGVVIRGTIQVPHGHFLMVHIEFLKLACTESVKEVLILGRETGVNLQAAYIICRSCVHNETTKLPIIIDSAYDFELESDNKICNSDVYYPNVKLHFISTIEDPRRKLVKDYTSPSTGFITQWGYDGLSQSLCGMNASTFIILPTDHTLMFSFSKIDIEFIQQCQNKKLKFNGVFVFSVYPNGTKQQLVKECGSVITQAFVWHTSVEIHFITSYPTIRCEWTGIGFKMLFSFHTMNKTPRKLDKGLFDCSDPLMYSSFQQHLHCNTEVECDGGEDEGGHCPFSSPQCKGMVASRKKCYKIFQHGYVHDESLVQVGIDWVSAKEFCRQKNGQLAMVKTDQELQDFAKLYQYGKSVPTAYIGVYSGDAQSPKMYKQFFKWVDGSTVLNLPISEPSVKSYALENIGHDLESRLCGFVQYHGKPVVMLDQNMCQSPDAILHYACEFNLDAPENSLKSAKFPKMTSVTSALKRQGNLSLTTCPIGHLTHSLLLCDREANCETKGWDQVCAVQSPGHTGFRGRMFVCETGRTAPYTLLCDFRQDCEDASDESFCVHVLPCQGFRCDNGQCLTRGQRCDMFKDCWDESDEAECEFYTGVDIALRSGVQPPAIITINSTFHVFQRPPKSLNDSCPETHFACFDGHYLPVYMYCNGVADCPDKEDEKNCQQHQCPGYYRCRSSSVCVHPEYLCDGWPQCPQHDDEWLCNAVCPISCFCQGLSLVCENSFDLNLYPQLRYLDASSSGMSMSSIAESIYLIYLRLAYCSIETLGVPYLPNLRILDLSHNKLVILSMDLLSRLINLRELYLSDNKLFAIHTSSSKISAPHLRLFDLSMNMLDSFSFQALESLTSIETLNYSFNQVSFINESCFTYLKNLTNLDISGNQLLENSHLNVFNKMFSLKSLKTDHFLLCCPEIHHASFRASGVCQSPQSVLSSCANLIDSQLVRASLWIVAVSAITGNVAYLFFRFTVWKSTLSSGFNILLTNLNISDTLMGIYMLTVASADLVFRGQYQQFDAFWRNSKACATCGVLFFLSYEASLFLMLLLLFDRITALQEKWPYHLCTLSAAALSVVCWAVALFIVSVNVSKLTSQWELYSLNGLCFPLPISVESYANERYLFGLRVVANLVLCICLLCGQVCLFWCLRPGSVTRMNLQLEDDIFKTRQTGVAILIKGVTCTSVAVFPLVKSTWPGLLHSELNVLGHLLISPLSMALNPLLMSLKAYNMKQHKNKEEKMIQKLKKMKTAMELANK